MIEFLKCTALGAAWVLGVIGVMLGVPLAAGDMAYVAHMTIGVCFVAFCYVLGAIIRA